jgi:hypothetical protein
LAVLLDALDGVALSDTERAFAWLAGFEAHTVENVAAVVVRRAHIGGPWIVQRPHGAPSRRRCARHGTAGVDPSDAMTTQLMEAYAKKFSEVDVPDVSIPIGQWPLVRIRRLRQ